MSGARRQWSKDEDTIMIDLVRRHGTKNWSIISEGLSDSSGIPRTGKQCRTRYLNHLDPGINRSPWTDEENAILHEAQAKFGNKWAKIASMLQGRTDNQIKNHWYSTLRRTVRKIHKEVERNKAVTAQGGPAAAQMDEVIEQLSETDAASFKRCYEVLQQSLTGQASPTSILTSGLPKCVTSAITNPPARSKKRGKKAPAAPARSPPLAPSPAQGGMPPPSHPHQGGLVPQRYAPPPGSMGYPGYPPYAHPQHAGGQAYPPPMGYYPHPGFAQGGGGFGPPTAVMGPDGNLYLTYPSHNGGGGPIAMPAQPPPGGMPMMVPHPTGHSSSSRTSSSSSVKLPATVGVGAAPSSVLPAPPTSVGGVKRRRSAGPALTPISTSAALDPAKLQNLLPQHTPGGSLIPARRRAHTTLLLGMLSKTAQPTEQPRDAAAAQAQKYTVHYSPADQEGGERPSKAQRTSSDPGGSAHMPPLTMSDSLGDGGPIPPPLASYTSLDRESGARLTYSAVGQGGVVEVAPSPAPPAPGASAPLTTVASGLLHNATTLLTSQTADTLMSLGVTPRSAGGPGSGGGGSRFFADEPPFPPARVSAAPHSAARARERALGGGEAASQLGAAGSPTGGGPGAGLGGRPASPLAAPAPLEAAALLHAQSSLDTLGVGGVGGGREGLLLDPDAIASFFALPPPLRTPGGLGAVAAGAAGAPPGAQVTIRQASDATTGSSVARMGSDASEALAGAATLLGTHPGLQTMVTPSIQVVDSDEVGAAAGRGGRGPPPPLADLVSPRNGRPAATPRVLTTQSTASGIFFGITPRDSAGGTHGAPMLFDFS